MLAAYSRSRYRSEPYPTTLVLHPTNASFHSLCVTRVLPNCHFEVDDFESDWSFKTPFDFIHARTLAGSVRDFPRLYRRMIENLNTGGWAEVVDFTVEAFSDDGTLNNAPNVVKWIKLLDEASSKFGKRLNIASTHKQGLIDAGFKNVKEDIYKVSCV